MTNSTRHCRTHPLQFKMGFNIAKFLHVKQAHPAPNTRLHLTTSCTSHHRLGLPSPSFIRRLGLPSPSYIHSYCACVVVLRDDSHYCRPQLLTPPFSSFCSEWFVGGLMSGLGTNSHPPPLPPHIHTHLPCLFFHVLHKPITHPHTHPTSTYPSPRNVHLMLGSRLRHRLHIRLNKLRTKAPF